MRNDGGGFLKQVYDEHAFDLATGWHQYRNDPAVSTTVWYRSGQPKGAPWTNQWGWEDKTVDKTIDDAATEIDPAKRAGAHRAGTIFGFPPDAVRSTSPSPRACGERVGVRGSLHNGDLSIDLYPLTRIAKGDPTSPRKRGEVTVHRCPIPSKTL